MELLKDRAGMKVFKTDYNTVIKQAVDAENREGLQNAWRFLKALEYGEVKYSPRPINLTHDSLEMEYVEEQPHDDLVDLQENMRREFIKLVFEFQRKGIRHGDLTRPNYKVKGYIPVVYDWDQSNFVWEDRPQKRPQTDAYHLYKSFTAVVPDTNRIMRRWLAVREEIAEFKGWGNLLDLGCFEGDFTSLAQSEGFYATGVDNASIRSNCIFNAKKRWNQYGCNFLNVDFAGLILEHNLTKTFTSDITLLFSAWAYVVEKYGETQALTVLQYIIDHTNVLFFETQLSGDGPGPGFLPDDESVREMLLTLATSVEPIVTIPVTGRDAERTVWKVMR